MEKKIMINEEIVEIRRIRHEISAQFNHDPRKVVAYYRNQEKKFLQSGEFRLTENVSRQSILKNGK
jgi:uncharacterized coiled-coil DUF342 family protein